jgi:ADP-ribose pyrophosphatase YjhB (NUDIX family)
MEEAQRRGHAAQFAVVDTVPPEAAAWPVHAYATGGGVVVDRDAVLLLRRAHEVRLPKGHLEPDETVALCALREVREETGLRAPAISAPLGLIENRFAYAGQRFVRHETWFLMRTDSRTGDAPEEQWQPEWWPLTQAEELLSFEAERTAVRWARRVLDAHGA